MTRHTAVRWGKAQAVSKVTDFSSACCIPAGRPESTPRHLCWGLRARASCEDVPATSGPPGEDAASLQRPSRQVVQLPKRTAAHSTAPHNTQLKLTWSGLPSWRAPKQGRINRKSSPQGECADIVCTRGRSFVSPAAHSSEVTGGQFCFKMLLMIVF